MTTKKNRRLVVEDAVTCVEIDLNDRAIRKTWTLMGFVHCRTYELDDHVTVQIKDTGTILEGYKITMFGVYLASRGREIRMSSATDLKKAHLIQSQITEFLKESAVKGPADANTTAPGV